MHVVIIPLLKCKSKDPADVNNYRPIAIATALSKVLEQVLLYDEVTHYQCYSVVQMGSGKEDSCHHCCILYIQMT